MPPELGEKFRRLVGRKAGSGEQRTPLGEGYGLSEAVGVLRQCLERALTFLFRLSLALVVCMKANLV